ncbi:hypothetical protein HDU83_009284, partial [Entophlyctis luteolus]
MVDIIGQSTKVKNFPGKEGWVRCFAHVLNLVAKSILQSFEPKRNSKLVQGGTSEIDDETSEEDMFGVSIEEDDMGLEWDESTSQMDDDLDEVIKTVENGDDTMQEREFQKLMEEIMSSQATLQESENDAYKSSSCASTLLK